MLFKEMKFNEKNAILKGWRYKILEKVLPVLKEEGLNVYYNVLARYIEYLLEDTHYNLRDNVFYDPTSGVKFNAEFFAQVTIEYIHEHIDEFKR